MAKRVMTEKMKAALARANEIRLAKVAERHAKGFVRSVNIRLTLTEDAFAIVGSLPNAEARELISTAVRRAAKRRKP